MTNRYRFPCFVNGSSPMMSMPKWSYGALTRKLAMAARYLWYGYFVTAHVRQTLICNFISRWIPYQWNPLLTRLSVRRTPIWPTNNESWHNWSTSSLRNTGTNTFRTGLKPRTNRFGGLGLFPLVRSRGEVPPTQCRSSAPQTIPPKKSPSSTLRRSFQAL